MLAALACSDDATLGEDESSGSDSSSGAPPTTTVDPDGSASSQGMSTSAADESSTAAAESSSSGPAVDLCGNGDLDEGEGCDDGNTDDGDACRADCSLAFEVSWTSLHDGPASGADYAATLWIDPAGNVVVAGRQRSTADGDDLWLQQYLPDGSEGASLTVDGSVSGDDGASVLAPAAGGELWVAGYTEVDGDDTDAWVLRVSADLDEVVWQSTFALAGVIGLEDGASSLLPTPAGGLVVGGYSDVDGLGVDAWVFELDDTGAQLWESTFDDEMQLRNDAVAVLPVGDDDELLVFGTSRDTYVRGGFAQRYASDGTASGDPESFDFTITAALPDGNGGFVLAGYGDGTNTGVDGVVRKLDAALVEQWSIDYDGALDFDFGNGVALDAAGNVYLVGASVRDGEQDNGFIAVYDGSGSPLWGDEYNNDDLDLVEGWNAVGVDPEGDVVVAGYSTILGHQLDGFVRKYHPL